MGTSSEVKKILFEIEKARKENNLGLAIIYGLKAFKLEPNNAEVTYTLALLFYEKNDLSKAIEYLYKGKQNFTEDIRFPLMLGLVFYTQGKLIEAIKEYEVALQIDENCAEAHNNLGVIFAEQEKWEQAIKCYEKAVAINKNDAVAFSNLGVALSEAGKIKESKRAYEKALEIDPNQVTAHYCLGIDHMHKEELQIGNIVNVGQLLRINPRVHLHGIERQVYSSRIEEVNEDTIVISAPAYEEVTLPLRPGMGIVIARPGKDALYGFYTKIIERRTKPFPMLVLQKNPQSTSKKIQRRKYVRVGSLVLKEIRAITNTAGLKLKKDLMHDKNISEGGILVVSAKKLLRGTLLELNLNLPDGELRVAGQVIRCKENEKGGYEIGVRFLGLSEKARSRIIKYIYTKQIEIHRKGVDEIRTQKVKS